MGATIGRRWLALTRPGNPIRRPRFDRKGNPMNRRAAALTLVFLSRSDFSGWELATVRRPRIRGFGDAFKPWDHSHTFTLLSPLCPLLSLSLSLERLLFLALKATFFLRPKKANAKKQREPFDEPER